MCRARSLVRTASGERIPLSGREGSFEVVAGSRRLAALKLMAKQKKIDADHPVPCNVLAIMTTGRVFDDPDIGP